MELNQNERAWLNHMSRWGSDGYPIMRVKNGWIWQEAYGIKGAPVIYKTKKEVLNACERYEDFLIDKLAGRI